MNLQLFFTSKSSLQRTIDNLRNDLKVQDELLEGVIKRQASHANDQYQLGMFDAIKALYRSNTVVYRSDQGYGAAKKIALKKDSDIDRLCKQIREQGRV